MGFIQPADYRARGEKSGVEADACKCSTKKAEAGDCYEYQDKRATN